MRLSRGVAAIAAALTLTFGGCVAAQAAASPAAARSLAQAHPSADQLAGRSLRLLSTASDSFQICSDYNNDGCILGSSSGSQVLTLPGTPGDTFEEVNGISVSSTHYYELKDTVDAGYCLKDDPNLSNIVVDLACNTSGGATQKEEEWSLIKTTGGYFFRNDYAYEYDITDGEYLHLDIYTNDVNCYGPTSTNGTFTWKI